MTNKIIFNNADEIKDLDNWNGKEIEILGVVANPNDTSLTSAEAMPKFHAKLVETGDTDLIFPEEIDKEHWTPEMKAVLDGQEAFSKGENANPYEDDTVAYKYFVYGLRLGLIKGL